MDVDTPCCWVMTESEPPFVIQAASYLWYETWQLDPKDVVDRATPSILNGRDGNEFDAQAASTMMRNFHSGGIWDAPPPQRCTNVRQDRTVVRHTIVLVRALGSLIAISKDIVHASPLRRCMPMTEEEWRPWAPPELTERTVRLPPASRPPAARLPLAPRRVSPCRPRHPSLRAGAPRPDDEQPPRGRGRGPI